MDTLLTSGKVASNKAIEIFEGKSWGKRVPWALPAIGYDKQWENIGQAVADHTLATDPRVKAMYDALKDAKETAYRWMKNGGFQYPGDCPSCEKWCESIDTFEQILKK